MKQDHLFSVIFIGDMAVGKTSLVKKFVTGEFDTNYKITIGIDFTSKKIMVQDKIIRL